MNPFEQIEELRQTLKIEAVNKGIENEEKVFSIKEHYGHMINMLNVLEKELENAEYNYQVECVNQTIKTFGELTVFQKDLNDDVIIFQPIALGEDELASIDMQSLADVLLQLKNTDQIKENMLILPPNINVFRAKLARPIEE